MKRAKKLVFITSLERSGSTLLDITLGKNSRLVSCGEVARVLLPHDGKGMSGVFERRCSCGALVKNCPFWGDVTTRVHAHEDELDLTKRYSIFLDCFERLYGNESVPIDSSKFIDALRALQALGSDIDVRVLFTVRDVRGWISSSRKAALRKRELPYGSIFSAGFMKRWKPYLRYNILRQLPFWLPFEWYIRNNRILRFLFKHRFPVWQLSYEQLNFDTENTLAEIFSFIGLTSSPQISHEAHIVRGNRMAFEASSTAIRYDSDWLSDLLPQYEAMALPFVMAKNRKWVYKIRCR